MDAAFAAGALKGFGTAFTGGDFRGCFWHGTGIAGSPSEANHPKSNKSNARAGTWPTPPPPEEVEDALPPTDLNIHRGSFLCDAKPRGLRAEFSALFQGLSQCHLLCRGLIPRTG
jgi:hypothetical protein